jgi:hypothetical protein
VLDRVPNLLLILGGIYATMGLISVFLIRQPDEEWVNHRIQARPFFKEIKMGENSPN